ncbi:MAG: PrsW family glutamic-type intramembrane protease [bacterium]|nr:PrsW family glutamic-type intramembrane protease [bacterium]
MFQNIYSLIPVLTLAVLPSLMWLFFYLKEDLHPEPRYWIFVIFVMGVALAPLVIFLEMALNKLGSNALIFLIAPLVEETAKYGVVHLTLNKNPVLDEPVDGMIYVIVAALGFAAIENVFAIFSFIPVGSSGYLSATFNFMSMRFISAVALHGLASGIAGYYFARFYFIEKNPTLIFKGLLLATVLHGIYNFLITKNEEAFPLILTGIILGAAAVSVVYLFNRLKHYRVYQQAAVDTVVEQKV